MVGGATDGESESSSDSGDILDGAIVGECAFVSSRLPTDGAVGWPGYSGSQVNDENEDNLIHLRSGLCRCYFFSNLCL